VGVGAGEGEGEGEREGEGEGEGCCMKGCVVHELCSTIAHVVYTVQLEVVYR
jgi:hypothetical protein